MASRADRRKISLEKLNQKSGWNGTLQISSDYNLNDDEFGYFKATINGQLKKEGNKLLIIGGKEIGVIYNGDEQALIIRINNVFKGDLMRIDLKLVKFWKKNKL